MEQQPFESQLALVRSRGQWARQVSRPSADRLPEQFAIFAQSILCFRSRWYVRARLQPCRNQRLMDAALAAEGFSVLHRRPKAVRFSEETQT
jgi:hypothetical protein